MITIQQVKQQCRIDDDMTDEDDLLQLHIKAALASVASFIDRVIYEKEEDVPAQAVSEDYIIFNDVVRVSMLMLIGHWYNNREAVGAAQSELPFAFTNLLQPYRRMGV